MDRGKIMFAKVCGLKTKEQIDKAIAYGYDAVGVVTYPKSKRYCSYQTAVQLAEYSKGRIKSFVVGLTFDDVREVAGLFDYTQIYEARQIPNLVLASKEKPPRDLDYEYFIYDASIGSGIFHPFPAWVKEMAGKVIVAGGLNFENVCLYPIQYFLIFLLFPKLSCFVVYRIDLVNLRNNFASNFHKCLMIQ